MYSFCELYSVGDLIKQIFSSTVKCIRKCGGEWVNKIYALLNQTHAGHSAWFFKITFMQMCVRVFVLCVYTPKAMQLS